MISLYTRILNYPKSILAGILVLTAFFFMLLSGNSRMETDLDKYMPETHPAFIFSDQAEKMFGIEDGIIIALENPGGVYQTTTLAKVRGITLALQGMKEFKQNKVTSLFSAENIVGRQGSLEVDAFYDEAPTSQAALDLLRERVRKNEMIFGRLVSSNEQVTVIVAELAGDTFSQELYGRVLSLAHAHQGPETIHVAGRPIVEGTMAFLMPKDMQRMVPVVLLVIITVLLLVLRSGKATLFTLLVVFISTVWAFGLKALLDVPIYAVSTIIPVMLIAIGVADGIHMFSHLQLYLRNHPEAGRREAVSNMVFEMWKPVMMTSVTTAVGFVSLVSSQVYPIKYFGLFTAFGVMAAMVLSLLLIPAAILVFGLPRVNRKKSSSNTIRNNFSSRYAAFIGRHKFLTLAITALLVLFSAAGISRVWINSSFLEKFEADSEIVLTDAFINRNFGGTSTLNVILSAEKEGAFKQPDILRALENLQRDVVGRLETVGNSFSITDYIKRFNKALNRDEEAYNQIPDSRELVAQYLLLYEMSGDPEMLWNVVDDQYRNANLVFQLKKDDSRTLETALHAVEAHQPRLAELGVSMHFAGSGYKSLVFAGLILDGQILSLMLSFLIVFVLLALMFRKISAGLIGTLPILLTAIVGFGVMGAFGIALSTTTALISSIAVGVGIDYAVHFLERYRKLAATANNRELAGRDTISHSGRAILFNALVVVAGFLVLLFSVFPPNRQLGGLVSLNMLTSFVFTISAMYVLLLMSGLWFQGKGVRP